ncbi:hypothetical protein [Actibacterium lipolyticum]|uniref:hypothetical protein n=1 Tax=Actibacterium lipolyticum TaxID=1524263 RepID=UPI000BB45557|nr:hypothetical protein [Actibacterium lipolyticum]
MKQPTPQPSKPASQAAAPVDPPARPAQAKRRHFAILGSFAAFVLIPVLVVAIYLWAVAVDQYASTVGFSVRKEEVSSAVELLGGVTELSGSSSSDTDILYEFIQSQKLVSTLDAKLDLKSLWSKPEFDPVFSFNPDGTIEDLMSYWSRMVKIYYDSSSRLIEVRILAFTADDATLIAEGIFQESSDMINALSAIAREDAVRYSREELDKSVERLKAAREAVTLFRNENQIVDPTVDLQTQAGLLGNLQAQLAEALIDVDLLASTTRQNDPRLAQANRRVEVIQGRIEEERRKRGISDVGGSGIEAYSTLVGEYERLTVDREFAEQTYVSSLAAYDSALAESARQSRYLAAHVQPTHAERAQYPQRITVLSLFSLFIFLIWAITLLVAYSLRDRR